MDERRSNVNLINERNKINFIPKSTKNFFFYTRNIDRQDI